MNSRISCPRKMARTIPIAKSQDRLVNTTPSNREAAPIENRQISRPNKRIPQTGEYQLQFKQAAERMGVNLRGPVEHIP